MCASRSDAIESDEATLDSDEVLGVRCTTGRVAGDAGRLAQARASDTDSFLRRITGRCLGRMIT
jgi:hypothetical protein